MPPARSRRSKRGDQHGVLLWDTTVEPTSPPPAKNICFAPTVTPGTFFDPPTPIDPPAESLLFPPSPDAPATPRRSGHTKKKPDNHIPRPPNAFILFRSSFIKNQHVSSDVETNHSTLSKIIGLTWQNLPQEEKQVWHTKAKHALEEHKKKFPEYAFRPSHTKGKAPEKRKVREVGLKDMKRCAKIAELLVEGKKGAELDVAIAEFDRHHVPEIITRFEAPITARAYRRSSSAPVADTEHSKPAFLSVASKERKPRACSTQPESATATLSGPSHSWSSESDSDASTEYSFESSSLPSSPCELSPPFALPETNPAFDFSAFDFSSSSASPQHSSSIDPLSVSPQDGVFEFYGSLPQSPASSAPCTPQEDVFGPCLSIDTSFYSTYSASPSPVSSMPDSPVSSQSTCAPSYGSDADFSSSYGYFSNNVATYSDSVAPGYMPANRRTLPDSSYYSVPRSDFVYYEKSAVASYGDNLAPAFMPTYTM